MSKGEFRLKGHLSPTRFIGIPTDNSHVPVLTQDFNTMGRSQWGRARRARPHTLAGPLVIFVTVIFMPSSDLLFFYLLLLLVPFYWRKRSSRLRLLMRIFGLLSHETP